MKFLFIISLLVFCFTAKAGYVPYLDGKFSTQLVLEQQSYLDVVTSTASNVLSANAGDQAGSTAAVASFLAQPDYPRNLVIQADSFSTNVAAGSVVVAGFDALGKSISESFTFIADQSTAVTGSKAFAKVSSITFPAEDSPYLATWNVGFGNKLGFKRCMDGTNYTVKTLTDEVDVAPSAITANNTNVSSNTYTPASVPNGSRDYKAIFIQNYRCK